MKVSLALGADIDKYRGYEKGGVGTALTAAAQFGHIDIVRYLLSKGADPNTGDRYADGGALEVASREGHTEIVRLLLEHGANPNPKKEQNWNYFSPLSGALERGHNEIATLLIEHGADVLCRHSTSNPLYAAVNSDHKEEATIRMVLGALVNQYNEVIEPEFGIDVSSLDLDAAAWHLFDSDDIENTADALAASGHEDLAALLRAYWQPWVDYGEGVVSEESQQLDTAEGQL